MISPDSTRQRHLRRLHRIQTYLGVTTLALGVLHSGCFTARVWNSDTVLVASKIEGRTDFIGDRDDVYENAAGDLAYPGTMHFISDSGETTEQKGRLVVPARYRKAWEEELNFHLPAIPSVFEARSAEIAVNPKPRAQLGWIYQSPRKFKEAEDFSFYPDDGVFDLQNAGYRRVVHPIRNPSDVTSPQGSGDTPTLRVPTDAPPGLRYDSKFILRYNPVVRTDGSDALNVASKVVITPVTVAGDVMTTAVIVTGAVAVGAGVVILWPFQAAADGLGNMSSSTPKDTESETCADKPADAPSPPEVEATAN